jgi:hypothetical protein
MPRLPGQPVKELRTAICKKMLRESSRTKRKADSFRDEDEWTVLSDDSADVGSDRSRDWLPETEAAEG